MTTRRNDEPVRARAAATIAAALGRRLGSPLAVRQLPGPAARFVLETRELDLDQLAEVLDRLSIQDDPEKRSVISLSDDLEDNLRAIDGVCSLIASHEHLDDYVKASAHHASLLATEAIALTEDIVEAHRRAPGEEHGSTSRNSGTSRGPASFALTCFMEDELPAVIALADALSATETSHLSEQGGLNALARTMYTQLERARDLFAAFKREDRPPADLEPEHAQ